VKSFLALFCVVISFLAVDTKSEPLIIAAENDWVPYAKQDGKGMANDIIRAAFREVGIEIKYHVYPYARVLHYLKSGRYVAGFNVPFDDQSNQHYLLGKTPLYFAESAYYHHSARPLLIDSRKKLDRKKLIGVVRNYGYGDYYLDLVKWKKIVPVISNSELNNIDLLNLGRIDATILYTKTANFYRKGDRLNRQITKAFSNEKTPIHLAFSRQHEKGAHFLALFQQGLNKLIQSGKRDQILASY